MSTPADAIDCPRCGWRNDATARMCGGCGQPLPLAPSAYSGGGYGTAGTMPATTPYGSPADDTPTLVAPGRVVPPTDAPRHPAYRPGAASAPAWPATGGRTASTQAVRAAPRTVPARRGNCLVQALVTLLVVALVLGCLGVAVWSLVIRPPVHAQVDGGIRTAVGAVVDEANAALGQLPPGLGGTAHIPASLINDQMQHNLPANLPFHNVSLDFGGGGVSVRYTLAGRTGTLFAGLAAQGGRLIARNAIVTGPLKLVESSSELQQAVQSELAGLTTSVAITSVSTADHTLAVTVMATGG